MPPRGETDDAPAITRLTDALDGHQGWYYGAAAETLGESYVTVRAGGETVSYDRVRFVFDGGMDAWVFGLRARRSAEMPTVGQLEPTGIHNVDEVERVDIHYATDRTITDLPGDGDTDTEDDE